MPTFHASWFRRIFLLGILGLSAFPNSAGIGENDIAIVVRPDVPVDNVTFPELRRLLLGEKQYWSSNLRVTLLVRAPGAHEREVVLRTIYQMSEAQFRQYWIAKVFRAEAQSGPRIVYSSEMATELASSIPGAVAFVDASQIPKWLKALKINGLLPGQKGYPLH
jgi:ABC-type phosphate transport system substrate-binding protein